MKNIRGLAFIIWPVWAAVGIWCLARRQQGCLVDFEMKQSVVVTDEINHRGAEPSMELGAGQRGLLLMVEASERKVVTRKGGKIFATMLTAFVIVGEALYCDLVKRLQLSIDVLCDMSSVITVEAHGV